MNERKFLKKINSKLNKDGDFTHLAVHDLLMDNQMVVNSKKRNMLGKVFAKFRKTKSVEQIISDNFETIMNKTNGQQIELLCEMLIQNETVVPIIFDNFDTLLNRINNLDIDIYTVSSIFRMVVKIPNSEELIKENINAIIQKTSGENIFEVAQELKGISENIDDTLNEALEDQKLDVARYILDSGTRCNATNYKKVNDVLLDEYSGKLLSLMNKVLQDEQVQMIDITELGRGSYSKVLQIGEKVLKVGAPREIGQIPKHPRILQPLLETNFMDSENQLFACIELSTKAEKLKEEDYQEDKLYELYQSLRDDGIIWTDAKFANVGKIDGKLVVIDRDFIYKEGNPNIIWQENTYAKSFEKRYLQEKSAVIVQEFMENQDNDRKIGQENIGISEKKEFKSR